MRMAWDAAAQTGRVHFAAGGRGLGAVAGYLYYTRSCIILQNEMNFPQ
jgi:hypothetical protein